MASVQADFRRMLGYASISQMGIVFLLVSTYDQFGWQLALSYLVVYVFSLVLLWQIVLPLDQEDLLPIQSLSDFAKAYPLQAVGLSLILISMAGIPLTIGFVAKVSAIYLLVQQAYYYSLAILVISLPIAVYYYLGVVRVMLFNLNSQIGQKVLVNYYTMLGVALIIILSLYMDTLFSFSRVVLQGS
jgi:NADH-quinone oxidoreductase subunit N